MICVSEQFNISSIVLFFYLYQCSFQLASDSLSWDNHNLAALDNGCNLASITSAEDQAMAVIVLKDVESFVWLGGRFIGDGDSTAGLQGPENWMWTDGSMFDFEHWGENAPSGNGECMKFKPLAKGDLREWNDEDCTRTRPALYKCCGH